jgi:putative transposase
LDKYKNKYRIKSHRKPNWDYSSNGLYFLTILTQKRECNLGYIENGEMFLDDFGKIVEIEWFESFIIRKELFLDTFCIMPNHLHAIVEIKKNNEDSQNENDLTKIETLVDSVEPHDKSFEIQDDLPEESNSNDVLKIKRNPPIRLPQSIGSFIGGFKSAVNTEIDNRIDNLKLTIPKYNKNNHFFQPNYHDHIIRNHDEYLKIRNYIINNPKNWKNDKFYK